ncbi:hypothetical protein DBV15_10628 [Temnothorax longispinosus]|uniref:Uncharacterized protein n=1 Tax=Temnothorax longispinosus TaxID=300112 RepID=A0A4S2KEP3_9HYME|nr:hypothetical protein DBV15_10628 [Temnothorax longispinosus]
MPNPRVRARRKVETEEGEERRVRINRAPCSLGRGTSSLSGTLPADLRPAPEALGPRSPNYRPAVVATALHLA